MALYLGHAARPLLGGQRPQHYLGWTDRDPAERFQDHLTGRNRPAKIMRAFVEQGIEVTLVRVWPDGTREDEAKLKKAKRGFRHLCPECQANLNGKDVSMISLSAQQIASLEVLRGDYSRVVLVSQDADTQDLTVKVHGSTYKLNTAGSAVRIPDAVHS